MAVNIAMEHFYYEGLHEDIDLEDLIDDFTTFYTAGK